MAEFAAAALTTLAASLPEAAGAAGVVGAESVAAGGSLAPLTLAGVQGAVGAGGAGLSFGSLGLGILSGTATVASALAMQRAGEERARALGLAAGDAETDATRAVVEGEQQRTTIKKALLKAIGDRDVAAAASGVDLSFGTPVLARQEATRDAESALSINDEETTQRRSRLLERAASYRAQAAESSAGGLGRAASTLIEGGVRIAKRGY